MSKLEQQEFQQRIGKIEGLIGEIERMAAPSAQATARALVQALLDLHGGGLERILEIIDQSGAAGQNLIDTLGRDQLVGSLLILHGLHPLDLETRVRQALTKVRPYLGSHGGNVELLGVTDEGMVTLRLEGSCHGCASSRVTLKYAIEEEIYKAAPDVTAIEVEGIVEIPPPRLGPGNGFIPMEELVGEATNGHGWIEVEGVAALKEGNIRTIEVAGQPVLFCRVDTTMYAYGNTCPHCGQVLGQANLRGKDLTCTACGGRYDVMRAGRNLDEPHLHLAPFPLLEEQGRVKVALPIANVGF